MRTIPDMKRIDEIISTDLIASMTGGKTEDDRAQ